MTGWLVEQLDICSFDDTLKIFKQFYLQPWNLSPSVPARSQPSDQLSINQLTHVLVRGYGSVVLSNSYQTFFILISYQYDCLFSHSFSAPQTLEALQREKYILELMTFYRKAARPLKSYLDLVFFNSMPNDLEMQFTSNTPAAADCVNMHWAFPYISIYF